MNNACEIIKYCEGFRKSPYKCPSGIWTIGYGSTKIFDKDGKFLHEVSEDTPDMTKDEALRQLGVHLDNEVTPVLKLVTLALNTNQTEALKSFVYNIGSGAFKRSDTLIALNSGDLKSFEKQFREWRMADGKVLKGLVIRRDIELELFNKELKNV